MCNALHVAHLDLYSTELGFIGSWSVSDKICDWGVHTVRIPLFFLMTAIVIGMQCSASVQPEIKKNNLWELVPCGYVKEQIGLHQQPELCQHW